MTTIASDGRTVAADGQETWGSEAVSMTREKVRFVDGKVYAFTGMGALFDPCIKWAQEGADPSKVPEAKGDNASWGVCIFASDGVTYYSSNAPYPQRYSYPFSVGAGCDYAMGAMMAGANSKRAVEIASEKNIQTGGKITVVPVPGGRNCGGSGMNNEPDTYNAEDNAYGCWKLATRMLRLEGIRAGKFPPHLDDAEEVEAAREAGFQIVQAEVHRRSA